MTHTRPRAAITAAALLVAVLGLAGCSDSDDGKSNGTATTSDRGNEPAGTPGGDLDDAIEMMGEDRMAAITAEQLVGRFGFTDFEIVDDRVVMSTDSDSSEAELQCAQGRMVLDAVGVDAALSVKAASGTVNCEDLQ